jgi:hypothetical protein
MLTNLKYRVLVVWAYIVREVRWSLHKHKMRVHLKNKYSK